MEEASCSPPDETEEITLHAPVDTTSAVASEPLPHPPTDIVLREEEHHGAIDEDNSIQSSNTIPQVQISNVTGMSISWISNPDTNDNISCFFL